MYNVINYSNCILWCVCGCGGGGGGGGGGKGVREFESPIAMQID